MRNNFIEHHFLEKNNFGGKKFDFLLKKEKKSENLSWDGIGTGSFSTLSM